MTVSERSRRYTGMIDFNYTQPPLKIKIYASKK